VGSAAIAPTLPVRTKERWTEGVVSLLEPFIDTVVIITMTGLVNHHLWRVGYWTPKQGV